MQQNKMKSKINIAIIGAGSWGTTLSAMLAQKCCSIEIWTRSKDVFNDILKNRRNTKYTGNLIIPENVKPFINKEDLSENIDIVIFAVPSHTLRDVIKSFYDKLLNNCMTIKGLVNVAKGLEIGTNLRLSQVIKQSVPEELESKIAVLSGPNIAVEVANKLPSVTAISSTNYELLKYLQPILSTEYFRVYTNKDIIGVEVCGAVKNIIAIAAGISDGLGYGANTKASLITRGLYEITKLGVRLGANQLTFSGIAGMGDLVATCISQDSRNRNVGERIGKGEKISKITSGMYMVAEGIKTTKAVYNLANIMGIELPITECIYEIIYNDLDPVKATDMLMGRKHKSEIEGL